MAPIRVGKMAATVKGLSLGLVRGTNSKATSVMEKKKERVAFTLQTVASWKVHSPMTALRERAPTRSLTAAI